MEKSNCKYLFQDNEKKETYTGPDRRGSRRNELSKESDRIVTEITNAIAGRMKSLDHCIIPKEARPHINQSINAVKEIGEGSISYGINKAKDQIKRAYDFFNAYDKSKSTAINTIIRVVVTALIAALLIGIYSYKIKNGG